MKIDNKYYLVCFVFFSFLFSGCGSYHAAKPEVKPEVKSDSWYTQQNLTPELGEVVEGTTVSGHKYYYNIMESKDIEIISDPSERVVEINGEFIGKTPIKLKVKGIQYLKWDSLNNNWTAIDIFVDECFKGCLFKMAGFYYNYVWEVSGIKKIIYGTANICVLPSKKGEYVQQKNFHIRFGAMPAKLYFNMGLKSVYPSQEIIVK